jgi:hypothetical protein
MLFFIDSSINQLLQSAKAIPAILLIFLVGLIEVSWVSTPLYSLIKAIIEPIQYGLNEICTLPAK